MCPEHTHVPTTLSGLKSRVRTIYPGFGNPGMEDEIPSGFTSSGPDRCPQPRQNLANSRPDSVCKSLFFNYLDIGSRKIREATSLTDRYHSTLNRTVVSYRKKERRLLPLTFSTHPPSDRPLGDR